MKNLFTLLSACAATALCGPVVAADACAPSGDMNFLCGPEAVEDLVRIGDSPWLIGSGLAEAGGGGHLRLINVGEKSWSNFYPVAGADAAPAPDARRFRDCPAPPDASRFSAHGIALRSLGNGRHELLVVNHGGREAIEFFEVRAGSGRPTIRWQGCVPIPGDLYMNSVVGLRDGGFLTTHFYSRDKGGINSVFAREVTGGVHEWHPGGVLTLIPGTELSGANGIAVSRDEKVIHVAAWGTRDLVRFERTGAAVIKRSVPVNFAPDNLRWSKDGRSLLVAGQKFVARAGGPASLDGWSVIRVDPDSLAVTMVRDADGTAAMQGISSAVEVDGQVWVGPFRGDRVGYFPLPR
jgi:DNA-binding beta-propeller fold protein YncE